MLGIQEFYIAGLGVVYHIGAEGLLDVLIGIYRIMMIHPFYVEEVTFVEVRIELLDLMTSGTIANNFG